MKKKFISITFLLLITFGMIGCGKNQVLKKENVNETNQEQATENKETTEEQQENTNNNTEEQSQSQIDYINIAPEEVKIPILMYHSISDEDPSNNLLVPPAMFEEQMAWLEANNFTAMNMDEALEAMRTGKGLL